MLAVRRLILGILMAAALVCFTGCLGMDADEVLRLTQISGIAEMFSDKDFSASWDLADVDPDSSEGVVLE